MSLKPPKKSDLGKSWMKDRRDKARMIQPEYHLIASEGTETEPQYFGAIQKIINANYRDRIQLKVEGIGDNTVNLLMKVRQYVQNYGIVFKHVWIVYDTDDFPAENIDMVAQLCKEYSVQGETIYHAVWSNQCVELWYLLHFMYIHKTVLLSSGKWCCFRSEWHPSEQHPGNPPHRRALRWQGPRTPRPGGLPVPACVPAKGLPAHRR